MPLLHLIHIGGNQFRIFCSELKKARNHNLVMQRNHPAGMDFIGVYLRPSAVKFFGCSYAAPCESVFIRGWLLKPFEWAVETHILWEMRRGVPVSQAAVRKQRLAMALACFLGAGLSLIGYGRQQAETAEESISIVTEGDVGRPGDFGAQELAAALKARAAKVLRAPNLSGTPGGTTILAGIPSRAVHLHELEYSGKLTLPPGPEAYAITAATADGRQFLAVAGSDERGLMYALLELARRVTHMDARTPLTQWLRNLRTETGKPAVPVRGMIQFLHSADLERSWYYDREYWETYFGMLARDRFNSFNLVFAHQTGYLAPPYPFLFDVEEFPQVRVPGLSAAGQEQNLEALRMISRLARERGLDFIMGIWEQRAWKQGQTNMVEGLSDGILTDYARLAMKKLLLLCPDITGIQLRVNSESGIENPLQTRFYRDGVLAGMKAAGRPVMLDLRGWGALPETIDAAVNSNLPLRVSMKYWAEDMGMPYQAAQMLPSYSYADFLQYPRRYPVIFQVWSLGSHRLLPWGSVDWMKRFVPTARLGDSIGFETCAPLSQKGFGNPPGDWRIFTSPEREYYRWEFQRYWLYYLLYGRLSYSPETAEEVWMDEFRSRFGAGAAPEVFSAFQAASEVIPFLVSYRLSNPNMYIWPEKQMGGLLDFYLEVKPADAARFAGFEEYAQVRLHGFPSARMMPEEASRRLNRMADDTERALGRADRLLDSGKNREYSANRTDLMVLALLARYHARKILAAANLQLFYETGDESVLRYARSHSAAGLEIWEQLVRLTDGVYYPNMVFGPQDIGHWKDNLVFVRHDIARLNEVQALFQRYELFDLGLDFGPKIEPRRSAYEPQYANSYSVERRFRSLDPEMLYTPQRGYGWRDLGAISASASMRIPYSSLEGDNLKDLALPSGMLYRDFLRGARKSTLLVDLPDGEYRITAVVANQPELASGSFEIRTVQPAMQDSRPISYAVAETGDKSMDVHVSGGQLALDFVPEPAGEWLVSGLIIARREPHIAHVPIATAVPASQVTFDATITAPDGIAGADLQLSIEGERKPIVVPLTPDGRQYTGNVAFPQRWEGKEAGYSITATDRRGRARRLPEKGNIMTQIGRDPQRPVIEHEPVRSCEPGQPLHLAFAVRSASPLVAARLYYRHLTQAERYQVVNLARIGDKYEATIPGDFITASYDLMYYVDAVDRFGRGALFPDPDRTAPYVVAKVRRSP